MSSSTNSGVSFSGSIQTADQAAIALAQARAAAAEAARAQRAIERAREEAAKQLAIKNGTYKSVWEGVETVYGETW